MVVGMRILDAVGPDIDGFEEAVELLESDALEPAGDQAVVTSNMVMSLDGAYSAEGVSGGLSSEADHRLFLANRMLADVILVGAGTVRAEGYRRPSVRPAAAAVRARRGQEPFPRLVITSASLRMGTASTLGSGDGPAPVLAHPRSSDTSRAPEGFELMAVGDDELDVRELLAALAADGARRITCEGGPGLLGQLAAASLVDEYLLTLSPRLMGGDSVGLLGRSSPEADHEPMRLHRVMRDGDHLLCSFRRR